MTINKIVYHTFLILLTTLAPALTGLSQDCVSDNHTFKPGETITYVISYDWFVIWTDVGEVTVSIEDTSFQGNPAYKYAALGETYKSWNWIFRVKDEFISLVDQKDLKPYYSRRVIRENRYRKYDNYHYDFEKQVAYAHVSRDNQKFTSDTIPINGCTFDIMSALLYARNIDFSRYNEGDSIPITIMLDKESYPIYFRYLGIDEYKMKHVGTFECIKFKIMLIEGDMFDEGEDMIVWATNDKNRIVVFAESPIKVGSVKARLVKVRNNRYPVTSLTRKK